MCQGIASKTEHFCLSIRRVTVQKENRFLCAASPLSFSHTFHVKYSDLSSQVMQPYWNNSEYGCYPVSKLDDISLFLLYNNLFKP